MNPPPQFQLSREGKCNFDEIRAWATNSLPQWKLVERWRAIHGWPDLEFYEVLAAHLALTLHEVTDTQRKVAGLPLPTQPPDPIPPTLYQIDEPPARGGAILCVAIGIALAVVGIALAAKADWFGAIPTGIGSLVFFVAGYIRRV